MKRTFISTHVETASTTTVALAAAAFTAVTLAISLAGAILGVAALWPWRRTNLPTTVISDQPPAGVLR